MRIGIVGTGSIAAVHAAALRAVGARVDAFLARSAASSYDGISVENAVVFYADANQTQAFMDRVDAVVIATPTHTHREIALFAAGLGKPVLCEKPLALLPSDADQIAKAFAKAHVPLLVGHVLRLFDPYPGVKRRVDAGEVGELALLRAYRRSGPPPGGKTSWFTNENLSGGVATDFMIHDLEYAHWVAGPVKSVSASINREKVGRSLAILRHENGVMSVMDASWDEEPGVFNTAVEAVGTRGRIAHNSEEPDATHDDSAAASSIEPYIRQAQNFTDVISGRAEPYVSSADAVYAVRLADAVRSSAASGSPVTP